MTYFELEPSDISSLNDSDLRNLVARLCEAELIQQGIPPSAVTWGGAQEAADGGLDVSVRCSVKITSPNFIPREITGFQVKKHSMGKSACQKEMQDEGHPKAVLEDLASLNGAYIIVSGKDDCSEKMLSERVSGMHEAVISLKGKDALHLDFYGRDRLATWLRRHPGVALWVRSRIGKALAGWVPFGRWAATPSDQDDEFLIDEHPCVIDASSHLKEPMSILEGLVLTRSRLQKIGSVVRITGLSGVGKTRFAQALFESNLGSEALPVSEVIYADLGNDLTPSASALVTYLIANDFATYLVLDNCPPDVHRSLQKQLAGSRAKLRLLTIEYDISEDRPEETAVIHIEPSSLSTVSKLVQKRFPDIDRVNADRIAEFAGGNARVALALSSRVNADETLSSLSDEELFRKLFSQRKAESLELQRGAEALALVYSFNVAATDYSDELQVLSLISGIKRQQLRRHQAELLRRQLAQQRGEWRAVLPHALANRLAKRALEDIAPEDINTELFKPRNLRLFQSCAHRLGYLHDFAPAHKLALSWLGPGAPLGDIAICGEEHLIVLTYIAPIFPDAILRLIELASANPEFSSRKNPRFIRFISLLRQFAYEDATFNRSVELLLKFAETEQRNENHDSIVAQIKQLFSLHLSGTEATPARRQAFVGKMISSGNSRQLEIADEILDSAFEAHHWTSFGSFHFGARQRGFGWSPKTHQETTNWYLGWIQVLIACLDSNESHVNWAKTVLARNFRQLWDIPECFNMLEQIIQEHGREGKWLAMWMSLKTTLAFNRELFTPALLARIETLAQLTSPNDVPSQIEAYAFTNPWEHFKYEDDSFRDESEEIHEKVVKLGELIALQPEYLDQFGKKIWEARVQPVIWLGKGMAISAIDKAATFTILIDSLLQHNSAQASPLLLSGYLGSVYAEDAQKGQELFEHALAIPELKSSSVELLLSAPMDRWIITKLLQLADSGELEARVFEQISYGGRHEKIEDSEFFSLLTSVNKLNFGYLSTIKIMTMRLYESESRAYRPSIEVCAVTRAALAQLVKAQRDEVNFSQLHGIDCVIDKVLDVSAPEKEVKDIIHSLCKSIEQYRIYAFDVTKIIVALVKSHLEWFLDAVFDGSDREMNRAHLIFKDKLFRERPTLNQASREQLIAWCRNNQSRIIKVTEAISPFTANRSDDPPDNSTKLILSEHIKSILDVAKNKIAVVDVIFENTYPSSWSGSRANILEARSNALVELLNYPLLEVQDHVKNKLTLLQGRIRDERERERAENNEREQRFE